jgi:DNA-binding transcriptional LysR family regulator
MQIESIKVFCDVVRHRSFSQAAQENGLTQSAVSQIVGQLERRLGLQLIDRSTRPLQPTAPGQAYYDGCKSILEQYIELEARIRNAPVEVATHVRVAAIYSVGLGDMHEYEAKFSELYPGCEPRVDYLHPDEVYREVELGSCDFGLVSFPRRSRHLAVLPWRDEEMVLACAPAHRLATELVVRPEQLEGEPYVGFERGLSIRREVDRGLRERNVTVAMVMEFDNIENIKKAVEIGAGVSLLPEPTIRKEVQAGSLKSVPLAGWRLVRPLGIIHRKSPQLSKAAQQFIALLRRDGVAEATPRTAAHRSPGPQSNGGPEAPSSHRDRNAAAAR